MTLEKPLHTSESSFPILAISIIGIIATSVILLSYYVFVTKCCLNWHHFSSGRRGRRGRRHRSVEEYSFPFYSSIIHGLDECAIQSIPNFRYQRGQLQHPFHECSVCLNEFQEEERIRMLPNCFHLFHIDCIDTWLQTHDNCPICRSEITTTSPMLTNEIKERALNQNFADVRKERKMTCVLSMGDECIDTRGQRGEFEVVQPMRRSFSLDSCNDRILCIEVQEMLQNGMNLRDLSNGKFRRSFFSFSHSRSSKSAVLPV